MKKDDLTEDNIKAVLVTYLQTGSIHETFRQTGIKKSVVMEILKERGIYFRKNS